MSYNSMYPAEQHRKFANNEDIGDYGDAGQDGGKGLFTIAGVENTNPKAIQNVLATLSGIEQGVTEIHGRPYDLVATTTGQRYYMGRRAGVKLPDPVVGSDGFGEYDGPEEELVDPEDPEWSRDLAADHMAHPISSSWQQDFGHQPSPVSPVPPVANPALSQAFKQELANLRDTLSRLEALSSLLP